jgi:sugar phosphate permease
MLAAACPVQVLGIRGVMSPRTAQPAGLVLLVFGLAALVLAFPAQSLALVLVAALLAGLGLGLGYFGSQLEINMLAPPERRGEVTAAFLTCLYSGVSVTVITVGIVSDQLSLRTAVTGAAVVIAAVALATIAWHLIPERAPVAAIE